MIFESEREILGGFLRQTLPGTKTVAASDGSHCRWEGTAQSRMAIDRQEIKGKTREEEEEEEERGSNAK